MLHQNKETMLNNVMLTLLDVSRTYIVIEYIIHSDVRISSHCYPSNKYLVLFNFYGSYEYSKRANDRVKGDQCWGKG